MSENNEIVEYNGYLFNEYSEIDVNAVMQDDDSGRTTVYNRYKLRVETTIYAEVGESAGRAGEHFRRIRSKLTKKGKGLVINHGGFHPNVFSVNIGTSGRRDVTFGPHPRVVAWESLGHENAVHVIWECEFCVPECEQSNRFTGIMALNYQISTRIDSAGYTTRTTSGYIEIAMTRIGSKIPDSADMYRNQIQLPPLPNFHREHHWNLSSDKRRADFSIVDTEIRSPNAFPAGVINIQATHSVGWVRRTPSTLPQTIRSTIELAQGQPRSRAWEIFKAIVESRLSFSGTSTVFLDNLFVEESIFGNQFSFSLNYRFLGEPIEPLLTSFSGLFTSTGIGAPVSFGSWNQWKTSVAELQSHHGQANLRHDSKKDQIIDMCSTEFSVDGSSETSRIVYTPAPRKNSPIRNSRPSGRKSYLRFESWVETVEETPTTVQINVSPDDLKRKDFSPNTTSLEIGGSTSGTNVERFIETQAGRVELIWKGYAERVGYPIPRPDRLVLLGEQGEKFVLTRVGKARFIQRFNGNVLGQPVYSAAWNQRYVLNKRISTMKGITGWDANGP